MLLFSEKFCTLFPSFPNYTEDMYLGNVHSGKGRFTDLKGNYSKHYNYMSGEADILNNQLVACNVNIKGINISIIGDKLVCTKYLNNNQKKYFCINKEELKVIESHQFNISELRVITKEKENDCFIVKKIKQQVHKMIYDFCLNFKFNYGIYPNYFKDWCIENL